MRCLKFLLLTAGLLLSCRGGLLAAETELASLTAERLLPSMAGEHHAYTLDFLIFSDVAEGGLQLTAEAAPGRYRIELFARTLGVASWLTGERNHRYVSVVEADDQGRLRTVSYEASVHKRKSGEWNNRRKSYRFDYAAGKIYQEKGEGGQLAPGLVFELPAGPPPVDILTGFYNLRSGVYGTLAPGARLKIPSFSSKGFGAIDIEVLTGSERLDMPFFPVTGTLLRARVDPEVFETKGADMYVWLDEAGRPARGLVQSVVGIGDIYGHLKQEQPQP
jgi:Protein of unknown function (DUF3108)